MGTIPAKPRAARTTRAAIPGGPADAAFRRDVQRIFRPGWLAGATPDPEMRAQVLARPAAGWSEFAVSVGFLLERFGRTTEGQDRRMQRLIQRALGDLARLLKREERRG